MCKAIDVANFFIDMANNDPDDCMTNLRVNKLLYFAQAWNLVRNNKPLFEDEIQAWQYGPVVPNVYHTFKPCGRERIASTSDDYSFSRLSCEEIMLLIDVMREYGRFSSPALVDMTHEAGSPWARVYDPNHNNSITNDSLFDYFSTQQPLPKFSVIDDAEDDLLGRRDPKDGLLILPQEYDDESN